MNSIPVSPSEQINSRDHIRLVASNGMLRDEADVPYDGQTKAERTRRPFVRVDQALMLEMVPKVGPSAWTVYTFLVMHADNQTGKCHPSQHRLVELSGMTERTVRDALNRLVECGYLTRQERRTADGKRDTDELTLTRHQPAKSAGCVTPTQQTDQPATQPADLPAKSAGIYKDELEGTRRELPPLPPAELDEAAQARLRSFRAAYPTHRKSGNPREIAMLWAALTVAEQQQAIAAIAVWSVSDDWTKEDGRYVPKITRYLTEHVWESRPSKAARVAPKFVV